MSLRVQPRRRRAGSRVRRDRPSATLGIVLTLLLAVPAGAVRADAEDELRSDVPVEITADSIVYDAQRQVYVAEGSVHVVQAERRIDADWLAYNRATQRGIAVGEVRISDAESVLEARFVEFDQRGEQGLVVGGRLDMGENEFRVAARELLKTGDLTYEARDASFTTCRCPDDDDRLPWVINARSADVTLGDYATATNTTVDVLGIPTLWLPWLLFPVKTERATGILPPELKLGGGNGFEVALPIFWAAADPINVLFTPRYMTDRGFKPELLVEAVYGEKSSTRLFGSYLRDQNPAQAQRAVAVPPPDHRNVNLYDPDRWAVGFDNDMHAPAGLRLRSQIQAVSDNEYVRDFDEFRESRRDRFLESTAFGFRHFSPDGSGAAVVTALYRDDRQNPDRVDRDEFLLQRAPGVELAWLPTRVAELGGLDLGMDVEYTNFWAYKRADSVLDLTPTSGGVIGKNRFLDVGIGAIPDALAAGDPERVKFGIDDGVFQEGEPLDDAGHRILLHPQLGRSFRILDALAVTPSLGWHETLYTTDAQGFAERGLLTGRVDLSSELVGSFDLPALPRAAHVLEPRLSWAYVSKATQSDNPLFVPATRVPEVRLRQLSPDNVVLDSADRIDTANVVTAGFGNRFYSSGEPAGEAAGAEPGAGPRLLAELDVSVAWDFAGEGAGDPQLAVLGGEILGYRHLRTSFNFAYDLDHTRVEQGLFEVAVPLEGHAGLGASSYVSVGYRYRQAIPLFFEDFEIASVDEVGGGYGRFKQSFSRINQVTAHTRLRLSEQWAIEYEAGYSIHRSVLLTNRGAIEFTSGCRCWAIQLQAEHDRTRGIQGGLRFTFLGFGADLANPFEGGGMLGTGMF